MTHEDLQKHLKESKLALHSCIGSKCMDEAGTYVSLLAFVMVETAQKKQESYALNITEIATGSSAAKSEIIMKASDEYRDYLIHKGYCEALLEQVRNFRAKGKGDDSEKQMTS
ncbi:MAG: hypothetical protein QQN63_10865 [Nitrosopumilus sp.]